MAEQTLSPDIITSIAEALIQRFNDLSKEATQEEMLAAFEKATSASLPYSSWTISNLASLVKEIAERTSLAHPEGSYLYLTLSGIKLTAIEQYSIFFKGCKTCRDAYRAKIDNGIIERIGNVAAIKTSGRSAIKQGCEKIATWVLNDDKCTIHRNADVSVDIPQKHDWENRWGNTYGDRLLRENNLVSSSENGLVSMLSAGRGALLLK
ncbi:MAG: hypothetical protein ABW189_09205 [Rickettsiales bacterium]